MIARFLKVTNGLYRGGAPSPNDVLILKKNFGINKIISLDELSGEKINRTCKMLNIKQIMLPIDVINLRQTVLRILKYNLKKLLLDDGPTFVHCRAGKDRTGFIIALFKCKYMGMDPEAAIEEAKSLGFGVDTYQDMIALFEKLIRSCKKDDENNADIVSNERGLGMENSSNSISFAPYLSLTKQYPSDAFYNYVNEQSPTRENYESYKHPVKKEYGENVPQVGRYDNGAGILGAGPSENVGGFINE